MDTGEDVCVGEVGRMQVDRGHRWTGGQDTGEDVGMSQEVGRMQVWARRGGEG